MINEFNNGEPAIPDSAAIYLIPCPLHETALETLSPSIITAVRQCKVFFVENERSARRFLKSIWKEIVIDHYEWIVIHKAEDAVISKFKAFITQRKTIGIISEAGCPGIADPGQRLVAAAHTMKASVRPLTGPSSILLALMASGMNGQQFRFNGYLPIEKQERIKALRRLEEESSKKNITQIFIETPYRNNQLLEIVIQSCSPDTMLCVAMNITAPNEWIRTLRISEWKKEKADLHKQPCIFCVYAGS